MEANQIIKLLASKSAQFGALLVLVPGMLMFFGLLFGMRFVPSQEWLVVTERASIWYGCIAGVLIGGAQWVAQNAGGPKKDEADDEKYPLHPFLATILGAAVSWFAAEHSINQVGPYLYANFTESKTQQTEIVESLDPNKDRKFCIRGVNLKIKPFVARKVCDIDHEILRRIKPGTKVLLTGRGNWTGVIPARLDLYQ